MSSSISWVIGSQTGPVGWVTGPHVGSIIGAVEAENGLSGPASATAAVRGELFFHCLLQQDSDVIFLPSNLPQSNIP